MKKGLGWPLARATKALRPKGSSFQIGAQLMTSSGPPAGGMLKLSLKWLEASQNGHRSALPSLNFG